MVDEAQNSSSGHARLVSQSEKWYNVVWMQGGNYLVYPTNRSKIRFIVSNVVLALTVGGLAFVRLQPAEGSALTGEAQASRAWVWELLAPPTRPPR